MGKEIVYCGDCGKSLREEDFTRGKAHHLDNQPYCTDCKPAPPPQIQSSSKLAVLKSSSTSTRHVSAPSTRRRAVEGESSRTPLLIGAGMVVAAILILIIFVMSSGSRTVPEELPPPPAPVVGPPKLTPKAAPAPNPDKAAAAIKELEAVVGASAPPVAILQKCDEVRPLLKGTSHEARLKGIEDRAREDRRVQQLDASLEEVKKLRALDPGYERKEEIVRLLSATLPLSGSRRPEVEETLRSYQRDAQAYVPPAPVAIVKATPAPAPTPAPASTGELLGPYDTDAAGCVNHWLVLGPFGNRNHREGMYDHDLLHSEATHAPSPGLEVTTRESTKVRWSPTVVTDGKVFFRKIDALGLTSKPDAPAIVFAACWLVAEREMEVKFKMFAELGFMLHMDQKRLRNQPGGHKFGEEEDVIRVNLTEGPHLLIFKVGTNEPGFALRLRVTVPSGERAPGIKVWNQAPVTRRTIYATSFNDGLDGFQNGSLSDDGVAGSKALQFKDHTFKEHFFKSPITAETTIRFKVKLLSATGSIQLIMWDPATKKNFWYHVRNLKKGEWTPVEVKLAALRMGYNMDGPSAEGMVPDSLRFHVEKAKGVEGEALIDDLEILE